MINPIKRNAVKKIMLTMLILSIGLVALTQSQTAINNKILVVVDIQKHFTTNTIAENAAQQLIENTNRIIDDFKPENVVYIQAIARVLNISFKGFRVDTLPNLELDNRLKIVSKNIFTKNKANAFTSSTFVEFIENSGINDIVVVGLLAESCVKETLMGGKKKGYNMYYIPEAIVAKTSELKAKVERKFQKNNIKAIPINDILNKK